MTEARRETRAAPAPEAVQRRERDLEQVHSPTYLR